MNPRYRRITCWVCSWVPIPRGDLADRVRGQGCVLDPHDQESRHQAHQTIAKGAQQRVFDLDTASCLSGQGHLPVRAPQTPALVQLERLGQARRSLEALAEGDPVLQSLTCALAL